MLLAPFNETLALPFGSFSLGTKFRGLFVSIICLLLHSIFWSRHNKDLRQTRVQKKIILHNKTLRETKIRNFCILCKYYAKKASSMTTIYESITKMGPQNRVPHIPKVTGFSQNQDGSGGPPSFLF